jgi:hypothetical protein
MSRTLFLAALFLGALASAFAQDAPKRKSGLWEISMSSPQMPAPMVSRQCVDQNTDDFSKAPSRGAAGAGRMSPDDARRMAEELRKQYGK